MRLQNFHVAIPVYHYRQLFLGGMESSFGFLFISMAVTTTSSRYRLPSVTDYKFSVIFYLNLFLVVVYRTNKPRYLLGTVMVKLPELFVEVPVLAPFTKTVAPSTGYHPSFTTLRNGGLGRGHSTSNHTSVIRCKTNFLFCFFFVILKKLFGFILP